MASWIILLLILADVSLVPAAIKRWRYNTNFSNPDNWSLKRAPCPLDSAVFPPSFRRLGVLLPEGTTELRELVLPSDGELILPSRGRIIFGEHYTGRKSNCTRGENVFTRRHLKGWFDPNSWVPESSDPSEATPHFERIPCRHDVAVFPDDASLGLRLPELPVTISGLKFGSVLLTTDEWHEILRSPGGWRFFSGPQSLREDAVQLRMRSCTDPAGCVCLSEQLLIEDVICSYARTQCEADGHPPCYNPVLPHGHCCALCGSYLKLDIDRSLFSLKSLHDHVEQLLYDEGVQDQVLFHSSRIYDTQAQVVLVERGSYTGQSAEVVEKLYKSLDKNFDLGVTAVRMFVAGSVLQPGTAGRQIALVFGTLVATLLVVGGIFLVFVVFRDRLPIGMLDKQAFVFARFENVDTDGDTVEVIARPTAPRYDDNDEEETPSKAFDNPMYGKTKGTPSHATSSHKVTHENPVYSELKRRDEEKPKEIVEIAEMKEMKMHRSDDEDDTEDDLVEIDIEEKAERKAV